MDAGTSPGPSILPGSVEVAGLEVRCWRADDAPALASVITANLDHLRPRMAWIAHEPMALERRVELIEGWELDRLAGGDAVYGVFDGGTPVGGSGLHRRIGPNGLEIGYWVAADHLGQGIARRVSAALTDAAFTLPEIEIVEIHHDRTNRHSRAVPEALGFAYVGDVVPDRPFGPEDSGVDLVWRTARDDWSDRPS